MLERASPVDLRKALEVANLFVKMGINFVCVPVANDTERRVFIEHAAASLERMERAAMAAPATCGGGNG